ncbi:MAG: stage II sporulation protein E (SpoIIE) [Chloroflexota bacterium]|nr:MAG: stage II sporulation protein E (SpoIIE) [Chloroflexota bacterium]
MSEQGPPTVPRIEWSVVARPLPGETECGDIPLVKLLPSGALVAAMDGLGHGHEAAVAARLAVATLEAHADEPVETLVRRCHEQLRGTRGAAMTLSSVNTQNKTMTWLGVGNVEALLLRADRWAIPPREYVPLRGGVVGEALPPLHASVVPITQGDTLILASDGIAHGFADRLDLGATPQQIADRIMETHDKGTDDALVLVVRFEGLDQ